MPGVRLKRKAGRTRPKEDSYPFPGSRLQPASRLERSPGIHARADRKLSPRLPRTTPLTPDVVTSRMLTVVVRSCTRRETHETQIHRRPGAGASPARGGAGGGHGRTGGGG